ncbi:MAG: hypothetical protein R3F48_15170 [Candidatus Zixiibacteriota bacterium]
MGDMHGQGYMPRVGSFGRKSVSGLHSGLKYSTTRDIAFQSSDFRQSNFRVRLYRFMADSIPLVHSVLWTWTRLAAASGSFKFFRGDEQIPGSSADDILERLFGNITQVNFGSRSGAEGILVPFFNSLFQDGAVAGKIDFNDDFSGIKQVRLFDLSRCSISLSASGEVSITESGNVTDRTFKGRDVFYYAHNADIANPYGRPILQPVSFVSYIEQQLVDDMQRAMHNSGYHRLHVRISPPDKRDGETDDSYVQRANSYFDDTVSMIRDIKTEDNPVTWDDVAIEYIGPKNQGSSRTNNWYLTHRSMVEEICSGTNLAPFLLGYAYNTTTNWAQFKYDLIMRQVRSVQHAARQFLNQLANIELALRGAKLTAEWRFDNRFSALAKEQTQIRKDETSRIIDLYNAGLIDREAASAMAEELLS